MKIVKRSVVWTEKQAWRILKTSILFTISRSILFLAPVVLGLRGGGWGIEVRNCMILEEDLGIGRSYAITKPMVFVRDNLLGFVQR
jgi:hypothetical protein